MAGLTAGGFTVGTEGHCHGEATTQVAVTGARNGPKGTAVGNRTDSSEAISVAGTFTFKGSCWAASSIYSTGGAGPGASSRLPGKAKTVAFSESEGDDHDMQKRANSARAGRRGRKLLALIGLSLAGLTAGGFTVGTEGQCHGEATTRVAVTGARNGPKGTAVGNRITVGRAGLTNRTPRR